MEETAKKYAACHDYGQVKNYEHFYLWFPFKKTSDVTYNGTNFLQKCAHVFSFGQVVITQDKNILLVTCLLGKCYRP